MEVHLCQAKKKQEWRQKINKDAIEMYENDKLKW